MKKRAQGTIEYLVIIAVVVVISLIVVGLIITTTSAPSQQIKDSSSKLGSGSSGGISIVEAVVDSDGDSLIKFSNNSGDVVYLNKVSVGSVDNNYTDSRRQLVGLDSKTFSLSGLSSVCPCASRQKSVNCEFRIEYLTSTGLTKTEYKNIKVECVTDSIPVDDTKVIDPVVAVLENGTLANPWIINDCNELQNMNLDLDGNYILGNDVNCYTDTHVGGILYHSGDGFIPIGDSENIFTGSLNGDNYTIDGLYIGNYWYVGLVGYSSGNFSNINLEDVYITALGQTGALVGFFTGSITNCSSSGNINTYGAYSIGGLVGYSTGSISNSYSSVNLSEQDTDSPGPYHGGLVGYSTGPISNSYSFGSTIEGHNYVGGLVGYSTGNIFNSYSTSNVESMCDWFTCPEYSGGLAGYSSGDINRCYASGAVNYPTTYGGGLVGYSTGSISNSYASNSHVGGDDYIGGLVGYSTSTASVTNSYSIASSIFGRNYAGGLVGRSDGNITNSYSTGTMDGDYSRGGLVGYMGGGIISNSFTTTNPYCPFCTPGGLIGIKNAGTLSNVWWYNPRSNCCGSGTCTSCTKGIDVNAFYPKVALSNDYNIPVQHNSIGTNDWNFITSWKKVDGNYPKLTWE